MQEKQKILVVDDDANICELIRLYLEKEGYQPILVNDGAIAVETFRTEQPALVVLDLMLPRKDGLTVCREIRQESAVPVIILTAKGETFDKVLGLELGADDYMVKPFEAKELIARIKAVLRRSGGMDREKEQVIHFDGLSVNLSTYELTVGEQVMEIPPKELELLYFLAEHPNHVFTREQLLEKVWGFDYFGDSRTVDVHVKRLREKLDEQNKNWALKTVWGVGYKFEVNR